MINIVDKHADKEYSVMATDMGVVLCEKSQGGFHVLRSVSDLENLKAILSKIDSLEKIRGGV